MFRAVLLAAVFASASAFVAPVLPSTRAVARTNTNAMSGMSMQKKSASMPWLDAPPALDESMAGYAGFDPLWVSSFLPDAGYVKFLQEAEIKHCRVAMLAATGAIVQDIFTFPGVKSVIGDVKMTSVHDKFLSMEGKGGNQAAMHQILLWTGLFEIFTAVAIVQTFNGGSRVPGDFGFDPLGFGKPNALETYKLKEIKNGRLAMIGIGGMVHHYLLTGKGPLQFLGGIPNYKSCVSHPDSLLPWLIKPVGTVLPKIC